MSIWFILQVCRRRHVLLYQAQERAVDNSVHSDVFLKATVLKFINETKLAMLEVREHSPDLPTWVVSNYLKKLDKSLISTRTGVNRHKEMHHISSSPTSPPKITSSMRSDPYGNFRQLHVINAKATPSS